jgi:hypothetical protein
MSFHNFLLYFPYLFTIFFCIIQIFSLFNFVFFHIFHILFTIFFCIYHLFSLFSSVISKSFHYFLL